VPELPEVETVRRGLAPHIEGQAFRAAVVREARLRWPVPADLDLHVRGQRIRRVWRRGKYLIIDLDQGALILHLGMSGSYRLLPAATAVPEKHDHVDLILEHGACLRYRDPRRFGAILWTDDPSSHPLLASLGLEPLGPEFTGNALHTLCSGRTTPIKSLIMDAHTVVGVGNIYANEALFHAGIHPLTPASQLSRRRCQGLAESIRTTLAKAIEAGGSSLRDFVDSKGKPGYFQQNYAVYGRAGETCQQCGSVIGEIRLNGRSSCFCPRCQRR
jgi:formamidopyrimidine-DNA glycosylase